MSKEFINGYHYGSQKEARYNIPRWDRIIALLVLVALILSFVGYVLGGASASGSNGKAENTEVVLMQQLLYNNK